MPPTLLLAGLSALLLGACSETSHPAMIATAQATPAMVALPAQASTAAARAVPTSTTGLPALLVHKQESCGCCGAWVEHMREAGFAVEVRNLEDVQPVKSRLGIPDGMASCHTGEIAGYFIEGHVPASDVKRLLEERPDAKGLALPGMPIGSPGEYTYSKPHEQPQSEQRNVSPPLAHPQNTHGPTPSKAATAAPKGDLPSF